MPAFAVAMSATKLPSSVTLTLGGDRQDSFNSALDGNLSTRKNWQIFAGVESSRIPDADQGEDLHTSGANFGIGTNPIRLISGDLSYNTWSMADDISAKGGELNLTFAPEKYTLRLLLGSQLVKFRNLPLLVSRDRESQVKDNYWAISIEYYFKTYWSARLFYGRHDYSEDLTRYVSYALLINRTPPSILTTVTGFPDQDGGIEGGIDRDTYSLHGEIGSSRSALDHVRTRRILLMASYRLKYNWRLGAEIGTSKPENSTEDSRDNRFGSASITYLWY